MPGPGSTTPALFRDLFGRWLIVSLTALGLLFGVSGDRVWAGRNVWTTNGPDWAGTINDIAMHPTDAETAYVATNGGGLFGTTDGGATWTPVSVGHVDLASATAVQIHPRIPSTAFAGGNGQIYKTTDGGATWQAAGGALQVGPNLANIRTIAFDPSDDNTVFLGTNLGVFVTVDAGASWTLANTGLTFTNVNGLSVDPIAEPTVLYVAVNGGAFKSVDGAATWTRMGSAVISGGLAVAVNPLSPNNVLVSGASAVYRSPDGGTTWSQSSLSQVRKLAIVPTSPSIVFAATDSTFPLYRSVDGGASWNSFGTGLPATSFPDIAISPADSSRMFFGTSSRGVFSSINAGTSWTAVNAGIRNPLLTAVTFDPADGTLFTSEVTAGVFRSHDIGATWERVNWSGSGVILGLSVDPFAAGTVLATANTGRLYRSTDGGTSWTDYAALAARTLTFDPTTPGIVYAAGNGGGGVWKSVNGGLTWTGSGPTFFITNVAAPIAQPGLLYAAAVGGGVHKSVNYGASWTAVNAGLTGFALNTRQVMVAPWDPNIVYAATEGGLFRSTNAGANWQLVHAGDVQSVAAISSSALFAAPLQKGVRRSFDGGTSWVDLNDGLMTRSVGLGALVADPARRRLFAITGGGVFDWQEWTNRPPIAQAQSVGTAEDTSLGITVAATDADGDTLQYSSVVQPSHGSLSGIAPNLTYTPNANYHGPDSFVFRAHDGFESSDATVSITVTPVNDPPIAANDAVATPEDVAITVRPLDNDSDPENEPLAITGFTASSRGTVSQTSATALLYTPAADTSGVDQFTYTVVDASGGASTATVTLNVTAVNDAPFAHSQIVTTVEDTAKPIVLTGADKEATSVTFSIVANPSHGSLSGTAPSLVYLPAPNYSGTDSFTFRVNDGQSLSNTATVSISVVQALWTSNGPEGGHVRVLAGDPRDASVVYAGISSVGFIRSIDGGGSWNRLNSGIVTGSAGDGLIIDPRTPTTLVGTATGRFYRTVDGGGSWAQGANLPNVTKLAAHPVQPSVMYAAGHGQVFRTTNGGALWTGSTNGLPSVTLMSIAVDPANVVYVGSFGGGVLKSTDGGVTFTPANSGLTNLQVNALAVDPLNPQVVYAGSSNGLFKSANGGGSWTRQTTGFTDALVTSLAIDPVDPAVIYAGTSSSSGGKIFKSTDGANSWSLKKTIAPDIGVSALFVSPLARDTVFAGTTGAGIFRSTDGGTNWVPVQTGVGGSSRSIATAPADPLTVYAGTFAGVFRSIDGAGTWGGPGSGMTSFAGSAVAVDPVNPSTVYAAGFGLFKSTDGGATWTRRTNGITSGNVVAIAIDPLNPETVYAGTFAGVFKSVDGGLTWTASSAGLGSSLEIRRIVIDPANPSTIFVSTRTGIYRSFDAGASWSAAHSGLSDLNIQALAMDPQNPSTLYASVNAFGSPIFKTVDGGASWLRVNQSNFSNTVNSIVVDPVNSSTMYASALTTGVFRSLNGGVTWAAFGTGLALNVSVNALSVTSNPRILYAATENGVFRLVEAANDSPVAANDSYSTDEDTTLAVPAPGVLVNDNDPDGEVLTAEQVTGPSHGTLTLNSNGSFTYTPAPNYNGGDSFTYIAKDATGSSAATVSITVRPVNDAPVASNDIFATAEDMSLTMAAPGVLANDIDPDGQALSAALISGPAHGSLTLNSDGSFTYTPQTNYNGPDTFSYRASDATVPSNVASVSIDVTAVNDAPVVNNGALAVVEDSPATGALVGSDIEGQALTYAIVGQPAKGRVALNAATGAFTYTPLRNATGADGFTFVVNDGQMQSNVGTVSVSIEPVNDIPIAYAASKPALEDAPTSVSLEGVDADGDALTFTVVSPPAHGALSGTAPSLTYTPTLDYNGLDSFSFSVTDSNGATSATAIVNLSVTATLWSRQGPDGGMVSALAVDPGNPVTMFAADSDHIWRSTNAGATWTVASMGLNADVFTLSVHPTSSALYAGTTHGVLRSTDGGVSWTSHNVGLTDLSVRTLAIDPVDSSIYVSTDSQGVFRSDDGGSTWTAANGGLNNVRAFALDPAQPNALYAGTSSGLYHSTDRGATWQARNAGLTNTSVQSVAIDYVTPTRVYVATNGGGVFRSLDRGLTWAPSNTGLGTVSIRALAVDPVVPTTLYAATLNAGIYRSTDGGSTWAQNSSGIIGLQVVTLATNGAAPTILYAATSHGLFKSMDRASSWTASSVGLWNQPARALAIDPTVAHKLFVGTNGNGVFLSADGALTFTAANSGLSHCCVFALAVNPATPSIVYAGTTGGGVFRSMDGGTSWSSSNTGLSSGLSVRAFVISAAAAETVYVGAAGSNGGVFRSTDSGASWTARNGGLTDRNVQSMAIDPVTPTTLYAGTDGNGVFRSTDGGGSWTAINSGLSNLQVLALAVDPVTPATVYAGTGGGVFKSSDSGANWASINSGLTALQVRTLAVHPTMSRIVYAGIERSVFRSSDAGTTWARVASDLDDNVNALAIAATSPHTVFAATGAGISRLLEAGNDAPVTVNQVVETSEDAAVGITLGASEADGESLSFNITAQPVHGTLSGTAPSLTYTPAPNYHGPDSFTFTASDGSDTSNAATVSITVTPVNDVTLAADDTFTTAEDTPLTVAAAGVLANDTDADGDTLSAVVVQSPAHGSLTLSPNGSFIYTPEANYHGPDTFSYRASDGTAPSNVASVSIGVTAVNDAPVANNGALAVVEDSPATGDLTASDIEGQALNYTIVGQPAKGYVALDTATGAFTYNPARNATGTDAFTFAVSDGAASSAVATINVTIAPVNDAPVAVAQSLFVLEDSDTPVRLGAADVDGDALTFEIVTDPSRGTLSGTAPNVVYTPATNFNGSDSFTFRARDGSATHDATITLTVTPSLWTARGPEPGGVSTLAISPSLPSLLYGATFRSIDGGASWTRPYAESPWPSVPNVIAVDPQTPTTAYGAAAEGIFKTVDGGATWTLQNNGIASLVNGTRTVAVDPTSPSTLYAVAGEQTYKSTDGAATWTLSQSGLSAVALRFVVNPIVPSIVYAGTVSGVFKSVDGGATWVSSSFGLAGSLVQALTIDPQNPNTLYAGTFGGGVFKTTDAGTSWVAANIGITANNFRGFAIDAASSNIVYVSTTSGVFKTITGAASWFAVNSGLPPAQAGYQLAIDPLSPTTLYAAFGGVYKTTNGGASWVAAGSGLLGGQAFAVRPDGGNPEVIYAADRRGVYKTLNHGLTWDVTNAVPAIPVTLAVDPTVRSTIYVGTASGVFKTLNAGGNWSPANTGLTSLGVQAVTVDPATPSTVYVSTTTGGVFKSSNGGGSWSAVNSGLSNLNVRMVAIDPTSPSTLYATNNVVFKSVNGGQTWTAANSGLPGVVWTVAASPDTAGVVYAGASNGIYKTTNGGQSWTSVSSDLPPLTNVRALAIDPSTATVYAGTLSGDVVKTVDGGVSWQFLSVGLQRGSIDSLAVGADVPGRLYAVSGGTVFVFDQASNDAPVAVDQVVETSEDAAVAITLGASDADGDSVSFNIVDQPAHGTLSGTAPNLTYTPAPNYNGPDSFTFSASDGTDASSPGSVALNITAVNDVPAAATDSYTTAEDTVLNVPASTGLLANDVEADGEALTAEQLTGPTHGTLALNADGSLTYTPAPNYHGSDSFTYVARDATTSSAATTVTISIAPVNDAPVAATDSYVTNLNTTLTVAAPGVLANDSDTEGDAISAAVVTGPAHGALVLNANGSFVYTPAANYAGSDTFTYQVSDGTDTSAAVAVALTLTSPVVSLSTNNVAFGDQLLFIPSAAQAITLSNTGNGLLEIGSLTMAGANSSEFARNSDCLASLAPGGSCTVAVAFTPTAAGARTALLQIATNAVSSPHTVAVSGTGIKGNTTTSVASSPNPSSFAQAVTITATVSPVAPSAGSATGTVQFFDGAALLGTAVIAANGTASLTTSSLSSGNHVLSATYDGDANLNGSNSASASHAVQSTSASTWTTLTSSPNPSPLNQLVLLEAEVRPLSGSARPSGTVRFYDGSTLLGTSTLAFSRGSMRAQLTTSALVVGSHALTAHYDGNATFGGSISFVVGHSVYTGAPPTPTTTTVTGAPNPSAPGQPVTFTARVTARRAQPAGSVQFYADGIAVGGPIILGATGQVSIQISNLSVGVHAVSAQYLGTATFASSTAITAQLVR